ncbi:F-box/LRR-repeat protein At3g26922-like [Lycium barbarum]|uniref:F-box/LRR-repeat protein At3g26922-like n=1 Tax=Lycium barbarum TaxID=112863 RepID=UPI00293E252B|nr:F-box/LRR-repeat protein At3g26922-like [Lycium barbarum]
MDRISQLPEPILQHILSFLLVEDAARMSTLSKIWTSAWNSLSYLNFGDNLFHNNNNQEDLPNLLKGVTQILAKRHNQKISVQKFSLQLPYWRRRCYYLHKWINLLVACNIKELNLRVSKTIYQGRREHCKLPEVIFNAKALNVLNLNGFKIELPSNGCTMKLSSLRELHLCNVSLDEKLCKVYAQAATI